jgi:hypothetical protein
MGFFEVTPTYGGRFRPTRYSRTSPEEVDAVEMLRAAFLEVVGVDLGGGSNG